jgi:cytidine deaminase
VDLPLPLPHLPDTLASGAVPLTEDDRALIEAARDVLLRHYRPFWHTIAAAVRSRDGRIHTGLHLGATVGRMSVCAEPIALGRAILDGDGSVATIVALRHPKPDESDRDIAIVPPCGACREMLLDFDPDAMVIVPAGGSAAKLPVRALLALPYRR